MEKPILLDTDVLVDFFRGFVKAVDFINKYNDYIILSSIVVAELYASVKGDAEQNALQNFISLFRVVPIDAAIGKAGVFIDEIMASHMALDLHMPYWLQPLNPKMQN